MTSLLIAKNQLILRSLGEAFRSLWPVCNGILSVEKPTGLTLCQEQLDKAVVAAYGWNDYTPELSLSADS